MRQLVLALLGLLFSFTFNSAIAQTTSSGSIESMRGFAQAVEVSDGSIFIGEPQNAHQPGLVYIYNKSADSWTQQLQLSASNGEVGDGFGSSLSASDNRILVGAPNIGDGNGAAFVFERDSDGSWSEVAALSLSDAQLGMDFGASVTLHGDWAFVGAPEEQDEVGAVYVFKRNNRGAWMQQARIANPDTTTGLAFGSSLGFNGTDLLVGAPEEQGGAVYLFNNEDGEWVNNATLAGSRLDQNAQFGTSMALTDDQLLVGAPRHAAASGIVFVYQKDEETGSWSSSGNLVAYDSAPRYGFGSSLALVESGAWIGAPGADSRKGALYQFEKNDSGQGWSGVSKLGGPERENGDQFAGTMAVNNEVAVVGLVGADYRAGTAAIMERGADEMWAVQNTVIGKGSSVLEPITGNKVECTDGKASLFGCSNVDLLSFMPIQAIGGPRGVALNDIWGWTDPQTGKEYAIVGRMDGTSFVDISDPTNPVYVGNLQKPESSRASIWRDMKVYENHVYVVADNAGQHGMQVMDLTNLRDFEGEPIEFEQAAHYDNIHSAHNVVINTDTGYAYIVGSSGGGQTCGGGLHMVNIQDPTNPTFEGCFADPSTGRSGTGYSHDAQCVVYNGPDKDHQGEEICFGANETAISIANVEDKDNPQALSTMSYPDYGYVHQGWLTEDHKYFISNDELDEIAGKADSTRTFVWDVTDLDNPQFAREYLFDNASSDHNLYIKGNTMYQSNYVSGLQVLDVSDPVDPKKIGFFDTEPFGEDTPGFAGTWSNYPFFESGVVIMTSSSEGLFILDVKNN